VEVGCGVEAVWEEVLGGREGGGEELEDEVGDGCGAACWAGYVCFALFLSEGTVLRTDRRAGQDLVLDADDEPYNMDLSPGSISIIVQRGHLTELKKSNDR